MSDLNFDPHPLARNPHLQTILSSRLPVYTPQLKSRSQRMVLAFPAGGEWVRLEGFYARAPHSRRACVMLIHGWQGCADSHYVLAAGEGLLNAGYDVFRLNMRDHGFTEALNKDSFHGARLEEVYQAARLVALIAAPHPLFVIGFSLGGNFALRIAHRHQPQELPTLRHVFAINPSIYPRETTQALDQGPVFYRLYFLQRWKAMLRRKAAHFPQHYNLTTALQQKYSYDLGELIIPDYTGFQSSDEYYAVYSATPDKLRQINLPTTIITSTDDPIIPIADFDGFETLNPQLRMLRLPYGGHVGYIDFFPFRRWLPDALCTLLDQA